MGPVIRHSRHIGFRLLFTALAVTLVGSIFLSLAFQQFLDSINYVDPDTSPTLSQEQLDACLGEESQGNISEVLPEEAEELPLSDPEFQITGTDTVNILLIGQDRQNGEVRARSDTILLCTFRKEDNRLVMTSFLRDLYVKIPGYRSNRINAAYMAGGMKLLNDTLEANFGLRADGCIEVDFSGFAEIVDILGGVTLHLRQEEAEAINKSTAGELSAGEQVLNGKQALAYARIRKLDKDGDFSRTARQRALVEALIQRTKAVSIRTAFSLFKKVLPLVTTDLDREDLLMLALELLPMLSDLEMTGQAIPAEGTYSYKMIRGMSVLVADMEAARQLLLETAGT